MSTRKTISAIIVALASAIIVALAAVFVIALLFAGVPRGCEPPVNKAPSQN